MVLTSHKMAVAITRSTVDRVRTSKTLDLGELRTLDEGALRTPDWGVLSLGGHGPYDYKVQK